MLFATSLRLRLLVLILLPLMVVASLAIGWQYRQSSQSAEAVFDQKLSILALAVFRDLLATQGKISRLAPRPYLKRPLAQPSFIMCLALMADL